MLGLVQGAGEESDDRVLRAARDELSRTASVATGQTKPAAENRSLQVLTVNLRVQISATPHMIPSTEES